MGNVLRRALTVLVLSATATFGCLACAAFNQAAPRSASPQPSTSVSPTAARPAISEQLVDNLLLPANTCGDDAVIGWSSPPIQLHDGSGETFDANKSGAGVETTRLAGTIVPTGATRPDAVVVLRCTGTPAVDCCAGRMSAVNVIAVLDVNGSIATRVGNPIFASAATVPNDEDGSRDFADDADPTHVDGDSIVAYEGLVYGDLIGSTDTTGLEGWYRFTLHGDQWVEAPQ